MLRRLSSDVANIDCTHILPALRRTPNSMLASRLAVQALHRKQGLWVLCGTRAGELLIDRLWVRNA